MVFKIYLESTGKRNGKKACYRHYMDFKETNKFLTYCFENHLDISMMLDSLLTTFNASDELKDTVTCCYKANRQAKKKLYKREGDDLANE